VISFFKGRDVADHCGTRKGGGFMVLIGILILLVILGVIVIGPYNGLVRGRNEVKSAWSSIDVQLKRRYDLIPNLVETVKGYAGHERQTLEAVIQARQQAVTFTGSPEERAKVENNLTSALRSLFAVAESYPDLKANQNFLALQEELANTENKIGFARQFYIDVAKQYKNRVEMFPSNIVANIFGFKAEPFFEVESAADRSTPQVKF
jgi:LemA protein